MRVDAREGKEYGTRKTTLFREATYLAEVAAVANLLLSFLHIQYTGSYNTRICGRIPLQRQRLSHFIN